MYIFQTTESKSISLLILSGLKLPHRRSAALCVYQHSSPENQPGPLRSNLQGPREVSTQSETLLTQFNRCCWWGSVQHRNSGADGRDESEHDERADGESERERQRSDQLCAARRS